MNMDSYIYIRLDVNKRVSYLIWIRRLECHKLRKKKNRKSSWTQTIVALIEIESLLTKDTNKSRISENKFL